MGRMTVLATITAVIALCCLPVNLREDERPSDPDSLPVEVQAYAEFLIDGPFGPQTTGAGVCVEKLSSGGCIVLTVEHVCSAMPRMYVMNIMGEYGTFEVLATNEDLDLCIVKTAVDFPAEVDDFDEALTSYEPVYNYAAPAGAYNPLPDWCLSLFEGYYSGHYDGQTAVSIPVYGGSSGSAVFDADGDIIGLVSRKLIVFDHIALITSPGDTVDFLRKNGVSISVDED